MRGDFAGNSEGRVSVDLVCHMEYPQAYVSASDNFTCHAKKEFPTGISCVKYVTVGKKDGYVRIKHTHTNTH